MPDASKPDEQPRPKAFLSYKWGDQEYDARILKLAEDLRRAGVDVVFDKWHLEEGHDANDFMERAVKDPTVTHVLVLCEPGYAARADGRQGGVGTETLIISAQVYRDAQQGKFLPVLMERNDDGSAAVPVYMDGRLYIDLSNPETEADAFTRLVRRLWGKPELVPPPLGPRPAFLEDTRPQLLTGRSADQYRDAVHRGRFQQNGYLNAYLGHLVEALRAEAIVDAESAEELSGKRDASLQRFLPYRDEFISVIQFMAEFVDDAVAFDRLHQFFEGIVGMRYLMQDGPFSWEWRTENLAFLTRELLVYAVGILLRAERFEAIDRLLRPFHVRAHLNSGGTLRSVEVIDASYPHMQQGLDPFQDAAAHRLVQRATVERLPYEVLAEAEFLLAIRTAVSPMKGNSFFDGNLWHPRGAGWEWRLDSLPIVVRLKDPGYRDRFLLAIGVRSRDELRVRLADVPETRHAGVTHWLNKINLSQVLGVT